MVFFTIPKGFRNGAQGCTYLGGSRFDAPNPVRVAFLQSHWYGSPWITAHLVPFSTTCLPAMFSGRDRWDGAELKKGKLLDAAEAAGYAALITVDKGFATQASGSQRDRE